MRFYKTKREKDFIIKRFRRGNLVPFLKYCLYRLHISQLFFLTREGYRMRVWYVPYAFWLWTHPHAKRDDEVFFKSFLKEGDIVVDGGAHLGTLTVTASMCVGQKGKVYAFEAHPRTYSFLKRNVQDNFCTNVVSCNVALGDRESVAAIDSHYVSDMNNIVPAGKTRITMNTLDTLIPQDVQITLLKLDVEGCELPALVGARNLLTRTDAVYFESAEKRFREYGYGLQDVVKLLQNKGFTTYVIKDIDTHPSITKISDMYVTKEKYENLLALRDESVFYQRTASQ